MLIGPDAFHTAHPGAPSAKLLPRRRQSRRSILMRALKDNQGHSERIKPGCGAVIQEATTHGIVQSYALLIYQPMNRSEPGFLQGTIEARRSSASLHSRPCAAKRKTSVPRSSRSTLILRKNYSNILAVGLHFRSALSKLNRRITSLGGRRDVSFTDLRSIQPWRIAD